MAKRQQNDPTYSFAIVRNFPRYRSFDILKQPEASFFKTFMGTFSQLFKGE
jgi:hypothetical protein